MRRSAVEYIEGTGQVDIEIDQGLRGAFELEGLVPRVPPPMRRPHRQWRCPAGSNLEPLTVDLCAEYAGKDGYCLVFHEVDMQWRTLSPCSKRTCQLEAQLTIAANPSELHSLPRMPVLERQPAAGIVRGECR